MFSSFLFLDHGQYGRLLLSCTFLLLKCFVARPRETLRSMQVSCTGKCVRPWCLTFQLSYFCTEVHFSQRLWNWIVRIWRRRTRETCSFLCCYSEFHEGPIIRRHENQTSLQKTSTNVFDGVGCTVFMVASLNYLDVSLHFVACGKETSCIHALVRCLRRRIVHAVLPYFSAFDCVVLSEWGISPPHQ